MRQGGKDKTWIPPRKKREDPDPGRAKQLRVCADGLKKATFQDRLPSLHVLKELQATAVEAADHGIGKLLPLLSRDCSVPLLFRHQITDQMEEWAKQVRARNSRTASSSLRAPEAYVGLFFGEFLC